MGELSREDVMRITASLDAELSKAPKDQHGVIYAKGSQILYDRPIAADARNLTTQKLGEIVRRYQLHRDNDDADDDE